MRSQEALGVVIVALFLAALAGTATAASLDLPKWVIVPEDSSFSDVTLFCPLDVMDTTNNVTPCYYNTSILNATITFNTTKYPQIIVGKIGNAFAFSQATNASNINYYIHDGFSYINTATFLNATVMTTQGFSVAFWIYMNGSGTVVAQQYYNLNDKAEGLLQIRSTGTGVTFRGLGSGVAWSGQGISITVSNLATGKWYFVVASYDATSKTAKLEVYDGNGNLVGSSTAPISWTIATSYSVNEPLTIGAARARWPDPVTDPNAAVLPRDTLTSGSIDELRIYVGHVLTEDEKKLLILAGRKKLSEPANFRQIFSPMIDLTRDRATFYAGLEVSTSDPSGYVPVPESAVNMSITSAPKLVSDYTGAPFYYEGHFWYQAQDIQYSLPIQFETVRQDGNFSHTILLDEDKKTFVYEKEFKVTNPTGARINVVYEINPLQFGFSALQYPQFELDGVRMVSWRPNNSSPSVLIATDTLEPGEVSTHWLKSTWTISKEELNFPAKLDDFRSISNWTVARKLAENAAEGKVDTYVRVIKIDSTADMSNMTVLVPLKDVKDESDVIEAVALTGARDTLQVEKLSDGKVVVKVPGQDFVSGHAEIKVLYNKSGGSWFSQLLEKIRSLMKKILSMFGLEGG